MVRPSITCFFSQMPKMGNFLHNIHQGGPNLALLNVPNVLDILKGASLACWAMLVLILRHVPPRKWRNSISFQDQKLIQLIFENLFLRSTLIPNMVGKKILPSGGTPPLPELFCFSVGKGFHSTSYFTSQNIHTAFDEF